jgi:RNA polymerase sigma-70 factor, ECF subfamily
MVMQIKCTPTTRPLTEAHRVRRDTLDVALVDSVAKGDEAALRTLFARHNVRIYRFVLRLTGNASIAEEIVDDVFLDLWRHAGRFQAKCQVSTWLLAIARHKACSRLRRRAETQQGDDEVALTIEDPADGPEECLDKQTRGAILRTCLRKLSPAHREVIDLVYYHEKTVIEVALIVGIPANTVKTRMHYARSRMAKLLEGTGIDGGRA